MRAYALVDADMEPILSADTWHLSNGYVCRNARSDSKVTRMHRQITGAPDDLEVDHINLNKLDNRRVNLRLVTPDKQMQNRSKRLTEHGRPTTSQHRGVSWNAGNQRWVATVQVGKAIFRKYFTREEEAAATASAARLRYMSHQGDIGRAIQVARPW